MKEEFLLSFAYIFFILFIMIGVFSAICHIQNYIFKTRRKLYLNRKIFIVHSEDNPDVMELYYRRKLVDAEIINFEYSKQKFYLICSSNRYIVYRFGKDLITVNESKINPREKQIFDHLKEDLSKQLAESEIYLRTLQTYLKEKL